MINGIINIYKEKGFTSHDVVAKLRGILKQKKIGHTGTLDPDAEGVLPVCLGKGTKLCDLLTDKNKTYETVMLLGIQTDTQDISGTVLQKREVFISEEELRKLVSSFVGMYEQIPPMYSALKVNGKKLYELAREGIEIERKARKVRIFDIEILSMELPRVCMRVHCSKGTYIRTLCHDIGKEAGCGACMESLLRTRVERFSIEDSLRLEEVEKLAEQDRISGCVYPIEEMFSDCSKAYIKKEYEKLVYNGNPFSKKQAEFIGDLIELVRVYDSSSQFIGIYKYESEKAYFKPVKMFFGSN